ncbi:hypothetical protein [Thermofilum pendens]|uniref:Uncharacterized protein n=1 Tax=Thermofilum pendens (strain DSM 2475 / Hrk 5) TaxID=368408 RepID=A1RYD5_THEPD|nr:hypothetical protein [Thermofilum pendens]ABL78215.1 hypothetical protein Tpen_0814 [Thermofilum pendens Hrk 5]
MPTMRIAAVVLPDLEKALKAGGADIVIAVNDPREAERRIEEIVREKAADLVLVDDVLVSMMGRGKLKELKYRYPYPAIIELETNRLRTPIGS